MTVVHRLPRPVSVFLALAVAILLAVPLMGAKGGNSAAAKACQKGGWEALATSEDPATPFVDQGACVSYAAQGGTLTAYVPEPRASASFVYNATADACAIRVDVANLPSAATEVVLGGGLSGSTGDWFVQGPVSFFPSDVEFDIPAGVTMTSGDAGYFTPDSAEPVDMAIDLDPEPCGP